MTRAAVTKCAIREFRIGLEDAIRTLKTEVEDIVRDAVDGAQVEDTRACAFVSAERAIGLAFDEFNWGVGRAWRQFKAALGVEAAS
jgi:hypothetical protein